MAATTVQPVDSPETFSKLINSIPASTLTVLYFHAPWAAPCAQMSTVLDALASTYPVTDPPKVAFLSINAEELPDVSEEFDVTAVPFIVLRRDGKVLETVSGGDVTKVRAAVEKHVGAGSGKPGAQLPPAQQVTRPEQQPSPISSTPGGNHMTTATNGTTPQATKNIGTATNDQTIASAVPASGNDPVSSAEDLTTRLRELTNAAPCMLFMKGTPSAPQCGFSRQLVSILRQHSVRYGFFNILADEDVRQGLKEYAEWPTFPQLWLSGELVGGLDIVKEEIEQDPDFFKDYAVDVKKKDMPGTGDAQARAQATA